jgi:hypothetical protein
MHVEERNIAQVRRQMRGEHPESTHQQGNQKKRAKLLHGFKLENLPKNSG